MDNPDKITKQASADAIEKLVLQIVIAVVSLGLLLGLLAFLFFKLDLGTEFGFSYGGPSASQAESILADKIVSQSNNRIKLVSFSKTNGQAGEIAGVKIYQMDYTAQIEFQSSGTWLSGSVAATTTQYRFDTAQFGSGTMAGFASMIEGGKSVEKGQRETVTGKLLFEKTENGWRVVQ